MGKRITNLRQIGTMNLQALSDSTEKLPSHTVSHVHHFVISGETVLDQLDHDKFYNLQLFFSLHNLKHTSCDEYCVY